MDYETREFELNALSDEQLAPALDLFNGLSREQQPRSAPLSAKELRMFANFPGFTRQRYATHAPDGSLAAVLSTKYADDDTNTDVLGVDIRVALAHRRHGLGTRLLGLALETADTLGRKRMSGSIFDTVAAGMAFAHAVGAVGVLDMNMNSLAIKDLDQEMLNGWAEQGPGRAPGYSVDVIEGRWSDELIEGMVPLFHILDRDSPQPEGYEAREWTTEHLQEMQKMMTATDSLLAVASHDDTGRRVAVSHLIRRHSDPATWQVTFTMVDDDHRGHALGKWTKGAVNLAALDRWEGGEFQETANASTNEAMLGINHEMGFTHEYTMTEVEVGTETVRDYLAKRS